MTFLHIIGIALIIIFLGIDVYLVKDKVDDNTWSEVARWMGAMSPLLPWCWGFLAGHFWHPFDNFVSPLGHTNGVYTLIWLSWLVVVVGLVFRQYGNPIPMWLPLVPGFFAGWLFWPVR